MAQGNVENWLGALLKEALHSVHVVIKNAHIAVEDPSLDLIDFLNTSAAQVGLHTRGGLISTNPLKIV